MRAPATIGRAPRGPSAEGASVLDTYKQIAQPREIKASRGICTTPTPAEQRLIDRLLAIERHLEEMPLNAVASGVVDAMFNEAKSIGLQLFLLQRTREAFGASRP